MRLVGRDEDTVLRATNLTRFAALQRGWSPTVSYAVTDVTNPVRTAEVLADFQPDLLFLAVSFQSWWVISTLPRPAFEALYAANYGPWLGNVANNVPGIRVAAADRLGCQPTEVEVRLVAHHYVSHRLSRHGDGGAADLALGIRVAGRDVTAEPDVPGLLRRLPGGCPAATRSRSARTAGSAWRCPAG